MVLACSAEEILVPLKVVDSISLGTKVFTVSLNECIRNVFATVGDAYKYAPNSFELIAQDIKTGDTVVLNKYKDKCLNEIGFHFNTDRNNTLTLSAMKNRNMSLVVYNGGGDHPIPLPLGHHVMSPLSNTSSGNAAASTAATDDDLILGASASPTAADGPSDLEQTSGSNDGVGGGVTCEPMTREIVRSSLNRYYDSPGSSGMNAMGMMSNGDSHRHYVGLVNQAMTCYLNSLLQALYNTPEFRNALYNWEFDGSPADKSIPYQLQKLFVSLQTSSRSAVETTDLTHSFGWGMHAAWEQHDIQELCRVMFDALEQKFRDTQQANLINELYEGKMLDYVKCLECKTEKSREDTFLDIPLPVRPFASTTAYTSVEEALRAFVQPETLEGNNQYHCENCDKKCDAHKGLKFTKLPYLLTLHLKRFDFDYSTMHRIKLTDKVVFPEKLNLNSFVIESRAMSDEALSEDRESTAKCDDCSTTDYGSALDDESCQGTDLSSSANYPFDNQDDDEGIDVSSGINLHENEKNRQTLQEPKGPYSYELFSIMIHSGNASGGHYYAYIKEFESGNWYCYNDTSVAKITEEDIQRTYGGTPMRGFYSNAYTSSTNAYMLMYRQIDHKRNALPMTVEEFPQHITTLMNKIREKEENDRIVREQETSMIRIKVFCMHPRDKQLMEKKLYVTSDRTLREITKEAWSTFDLQYDVAVEDCRMVCYSRHHDWIECSFDVDEVRYGDIKEDTHHFSWQLEIRTPGIEWKSYELGGCNVRLFAIRLDSETVENIDIVARVRSRMSVEEVRNLVAVTLQYSPTTCHKIISTNPPELVLRSTNLSHDDPRHLSEEDKDMVLDFNSARYAYKIYIVYDNTSSSRTRNDDDSDKPPVRRSKRTYQNRINSIIDRHEHLMTIDVFFPDADIDILNSLMIPSLDLNQNFDGIFDTVAGGDNRLSGSRSSPQPQNGNSIAANDHGPSGSVDTIYDHSNSEDSSLSDSDRTLVGDTPGDFLSILSNVNSPADSNEVAPELSTIIHDVLEPMHEGNQTDPDVFNRTYQAMNWDALAIPVPEAAGGGAITNSTAATAATNDCSATVLDYSKQTNYFFEARVLENGGIPLRNASSDKCCRVTADKRITLDTLKKFLEPVIRVPVDYFKMYRQFAGHAEVEWSNYNEKLQSCEDCERLVVKLGRNLRDEEYGVTVYHLHTQSSSTDTNSATAAAEPFSQLFEWIVGAGQSVGVVKADILQHARAHHNLDIPYSRARLRKKTYKNPVQVYRDDEKFVEHLPLRSNAELFLQELSQDEMLTSDKQRAVFVRRWSPSTLTVSPVDEVVLDVPTMDALRAAVAMLAQLPVDNVDLAMIRLGYPGEMNVLEVNNLAWNPQASSFDDKELSIYDDGSIFYYRDSREPLKEITEEERKELQMRENTRLGNMRVRTTLRRTENALKIYLDTSPSKEENMAVD